MQVSNRGDTGRIFGDVIVIVVVYGLRRVTEVGALGDPMDFLHDPATPVESEILPSPPGPWAPPRPTPGYPGCSG
jgi:hypothetical protein